MSDTTADVREPTAGLFVVALPELDDVATRRLDEIRHAHDPLHGRIGPHFTFVFGVHGRDPDEVEAEVHRRAAQLPPIDFDAQFTIVRHDSVARRFYVGLVPERGVTAMLHLHASLHAGWLRKFLRRDIDFAPHITLARSDDLGKLDALADGLNMERFSIAGRIAHLELVEARPTVISRISRIALEGA